MIVTKRVVFSSHRFSMDLYREFLNGFCIWKKDGALRSQNVTLIVL